MKCGSKKTFEKKYKNCFASCLVTLYYEASTVLLNSATYAQKKLSQKLRVIFGPWTPMTKTTVVAVG